MPARKPVVRKTKTAKKGAPKQLDLAKERPEFWKATPEPSLLTLRPAKYLAVDGGGSPEGEAFQGAVAALYGMAYTMKMSKKFDEGIDYKVCNLEGLWWSEYDVSKLADPTALWTVPREQWKWKLLIMVPDFITEADLARTREKLREKRPDLAADRVKLETIDEGRCVQILHVGPYANEPQSIEKMQRLMKANGLACRGPHHEIYMGDPRRTAPEKLRTILRQPVAG